MPFAVFRRHQRTLMAALALFAMVAFTLDFSLLNFGGGIENPVIVELYGKKVRSSDLNTMALQRSRANRFMELIGAGPSRFGGLDTESLVDALILQHEADELGLPTDRQLAIRWLRQLDTNPMTPEIEGLSPSEFDTIYRQYFASEVTDAQLLEEIANQIRLMQVRTLPGPPPVTPLDVYQAYRDQTERVSARLVAFRVEDYLDEVPMPTDAQVRAYFDKYKDVLPDRTRDTPGFKQPHRVVVEYVMGDVEQRAGQIEPTLTEAELRDHYEQNREEFPSAPPELPEAIFAGEPTLTPSLRDEFLEVRDRVASTLARQRAEEEIGEKFDAIEEVMASFTDTYLGAVEEAQLKAEGAPETKKGPAAALPEPGDVVEQAAREQGLEYEKTPPLDRELAEAYGRIGAATVGGGPMGGGTTFAEEFVDPDRHLYERVVLTDPAGRRYLAWKVDDQPEHIPTLQEVRDEVVLAWRMEQARARADQAARAFAEKVREADNDLAGVAAAESKEVISTLPISRMMPGGTNPLNPFQPEPARPSPLVEVPDAGETFRDAYFSLGEDSVVVEPNAPKTVYYVMTRGDYMPAAFAGLYSTFGPYVSLQQEVFTEASVRRSQEWMATLRARAGLDPNWTPPEPEGGSRRDT